MAELSRRGAIKVAVALAGGAVMGSERLAAGQSRPAAEGVPGVGATPSPVPASVPATAASEAAVTTSDVAVADRMAGRGVTSEAKARLIAGSVGARRGGLRAIRSGAGALPLSAGLPVHFTPYSAEQPAPPVRERGEFRWGEARDFVWDGVMESLAFATMRELGSLLKAGRVTSVALTRFFLGRLRTYGPRLKCVVTLTEELALAQATRADREFAAGRYRGPLHGIPWGVKDLFDAAGTPTTCGVSPWKERVASSDSTIVARMNNAGAVLCAKLSLGELAMGDVWFGGLTRNPWSPGTGSSGSSAGSASAVAAGLLPVAIGTETLGSIVSPCVVCGTTGLRPTFGLLSRAGAMPLSPSMDKPGPITRSVEDCAAVLHALAGPDALDATTAHSSFAWEPGADLTRLRVGYDAAAFAALERRSPGEYAPYAAVLETLRGLGVKPASVELPRNRTAQGAAGLIIVCEGAAALSELTLSGQMDELVQQEPGSWPNAFRSAEHVPAPDYLRALRLREQLKGQWRAALAGLDVIVCVPLLSPVLAPTNLTGHPTLITRCGLRGRRPVMVEFLGNLNSEAKLIALASAYERATQHHTSWPEPPEREFAVGESMLAPATRETLQSATRPAPRS